MQVLGSRIILEGIFQNNNPGVLHFVFVSTELSIVEVRVLADPGRYNLALSVELDPGLRRDDGNVVNLVSTLSDFRLRRVIR